MQSNLQTRVRASLGVLARPLEEQLAGLLPASRLQHYDGLARDVARLRMAEVLTVAEQTFAFQRIMRMIGREAKAYSSAKAGEGRVHILREGLAFCGFCRPLAPGEWPAGHRWVGFEDPEALTSTTCAACRVTFEKWSAA